MVVVRRRWFTEQKEVSLHHLHRGCGRRAKL